MKRIANWLRTKLLRCSSTHQSIAPAGRRSRRVQLRLTALEDRVVPTSTVWLEMPTNPEVFENIGGPNGWMGIRRTGDLSTPLTVYFQTSGSATVNEDYQLSSGQEPEATTEVYIDANADTIDLRLTPLWDSLIEGSEQAIITLLPGPGYVLGSPSTGTITIHDPVNQPPDAVADAVSTPGGTAVTINVLGNDTDPDFDPLTITGFTPPEHGFVVWVQGNLRYTPEAGFIGTDIFTYTISDGRGGTDTATVTVNVTNRPPVAQDDSATTTPGTPITIGVLSNDSDPDGDALSITAFTQGLHGTVTRNGNLLTYTPPADYTGADNFGYTISDGRGGTASATVWLAVVPSDSPNVARVSISAPDDDASEVGPNGDGVDPGELGLTRSGGDLTQPLTVNVSIGGTATSGADYEPIATPVTFAANSTTVSITVTPKKDNLVEGTETVVGLLTGGAGYVVVGPAQATVNVKDDPPIVKIETLQTPLVEPNPTAGIPPLPQPTFRISRTGGDVTSAIRVLYSVSGTANIFDYRPILSGALMLRQEDFITIEPINDGMVEPTETLTLTLSTGSANYQVGSPSSATVEIQDNSKVAIGDRVWLDTNANGVQDTAEVGVAGITVRLLDESGATVATTTTNTAGIYWFGGRDPGTYRVQFVAPQGYGFTYAGQGTAATDSNADPATGMTGLIILSTPGRVDATIDAGLVSLQNTPNGSITGPAVVPGNSRYTYTLRVAGNVTDTTWALRITDPVDPPNVVQAVSTMDAVYDTASDTTMRSITLEFKNTSPAKIVLEAKRGTDVVASKDITLVQVVVGGSLQAGQVVFPTEPVIAQGVVIGGSNSGTIQGNQATPGLRWSADITLVGPNNNEGVDQINVGFIQHVTIARNEGQYTAGGELSPPRWLIGPGQGYTYLDVVGGLESGRPWYATLPDFTFFNATAAQSSKTIKGFDSPRSFLPLTWPQDSFTSIVANYPGHLDLLRNLFSDFRFTLDVAVQTKDATGGASGSFWAESRANWSYNGSGQLASVTPVRNSAGQIINFTLAWNPAGAGVTVESPTWTALTSVMSEDISGTIANELAQYPFVYSSVP